MKVINLLEAKTHFSSLVERVRGGEEVVIGKRGEPVAKLIPYPSPKLPRPLGGLEGKIVMAEDFDEESGQVLKLFKIPNKALRK